MTSESPKLFDSKRFTPLKQLGKGGMGEVYLAEDQAANRMRVAVKRIVAAALNSEEAVLRFKKEIASHQSIQSERVVRPIDVIVENGTILYSMEYLSSGTIKDEIKRGRVSLERAHHLLTECAFGLHDIHTAGYVHRDIKPENLFITEAGTVKIGDFGLARVVGSEPMTQENIILGTTQYIPPEYIETGETDRRGDLYSLGVIGYELIASKSPFLGNSTAEILKSKFQPISVTPLFETAASKEFIGIILKLLSLKVMDRFQTADELVTQLKAISPR